MHACGHDVHMAALTALGRAARALGPDLPTALLALLQPREETFPSGARDIVGLRRAGRAPAAGRHRRAPPAPAAGGHRRGRRGHRQRLLGRARDHRDRRAAGTPATRTWPSTRCRRCAPRWSRCSRSASRLADPTHAVVASVGAMRAGRAANVIPETAEARARCATLDPADRPRCRRPCAEIVTSTCPAYGCGGEVTITEGEPALVNDPALTTASWPWRAPGRLRDGGRLPVVRRRRLLLYLTARRADAVRRDARAVRCTTRSSCRRTSLVAAVARAMLAGYLAALTRLPVSSRLRLPARPRRIPSRAAGPA